MPQTRNDKRLDHTSYKWLAQCSANPDKCMAPTKTGSRCGLLTKTDSKAKAAILWNAMTSHPAGAERDAYIRAFLQTQCCSRWHAPLLQGVNGKPCLDGLVVAYSQYLQTLTPPSRGMTLRSGRVVGDLQSVLQEYQKPPALFTSYQSGCPESVRDSLVESSNKNNTEAGHVYCLTWPTHPGFVKLGYTKNLKQRLQNLKRCHPGIVVSKDIKFQFPKKMERLIHAEMAAYRRKLTGCENCNITHQEWFEVPVSKMHEVMEAWSKADSRVPFYNGDGNLMETWTLRIEFAVGPITGKSLNDLLDLEEGIKKEDVDEVKPCIVKTESERKTEAEAEASSSAGAVTIRRRRRLAKKEPTPEIPLSAVKQEVVDTDEPQATTSASSVSVPRSSSVEKVDNSTIVKCEPVVAYISSWQIESADRLEGPKS